MDGVDSIVFPEDVDGVTAGGLTCTFTGELTGPAGTAETDVVTVTVADDDRSVGTASDDATIRLVEPGTTPTSTTTTSTASPRSTSTTATQPGSPSLAKTGAPLRTTAALGLGLLGSGLLLTGLGVTPPSRRRRGPRAAGST